MKKVLKKKLSNLQTGLFQGRPLKHIKYEEKKVKVEKAAEAAIKCYREMMIIKKISKMMKKMRETKKDLKRGPMIEEEVLHSSFVQQQQ